MAMLSVLEKTPTTHYSAQRDETVAELQHTKDMEVYRKMLYAGLSPEEAVSDVAVAEPKAEPALAAQRIADYRSYAAPSGKRMLFEGISYKNGELVDATGAVIGQPELVSAPVQEVLSVPEVAPSEEDDAMPTRQTMETLHLATSENVAVEEKTSILSMLSTKAKIALVSVATAIILALVLICINTGIIRSLTANAEGLRMRVEEQRQTYEELARQVEDIENFEGPISEQVEEYAKANGMLKN